MDLLRNRTCNHRSVALRDCIAFASAASLLFVLNLYLLVPKSIRKLSRDDTRQIKWRMCSVLITIIFNLAVYPFFFCENDKVHDDNEHVKTLGSILGFGGWTWRQTFLPFCHALVLYIGPIVTSILRRLALFRLTKRRSNTHKLRTNVQVTFLQKISRSFTWPKIRNYLIAPLAEEVTFRSCIITPFLHLEEFENGRISLTAISWCTPLFFGIAHLHHALQNVKEKNCRVKIVILTSVFQFLYTTVFGAYASFCFIKTGSLLGVIMLHSFCNFMGLPSLDFFFLNSEIINELKLFKVIGFLAYVMGIVCFWNGFKSSEWTHHTY